MHRKTILVIGAPLDPGGAHPGCLLGPDALRAAGLNSALATLGFHIEDAGNISPRATDIFVGPMCPTHPHIPDCAECLAWVRSLQCTAYSAFQQSTVPVFLGGNHLMAAGTVSGIAKRSAEQAREQFVLWLDAHTDFHTLESTQTGNLHGTPVAYFTGQPGFAPHFPDAPAPVKFENICMLGIRSIDPEERRSLRDKNMPIHAMKEVAARGAERLLSPFLDRVRKSRGNLHVSIDIDVFDPSIAPAAATPVAGGIKRTQALDMMSMLFASGLVTSVEVAELNPLLDDRGRTARFVVDLLACLFGGRTLEKSNERKRRLSLAG